jgi:uncharacterized membrane protein
MTRPAGTLDNVIAAAVRRDRRTRTDRWLKALGGVLAFAIASANSGWALMLAVGVVRHEWIRDCPTIGYWNALVLGLLLRSALMIPSSYGRKSTSSP